MAIQGEELAALLHFHREQVSAQVMDIADPSNGNVAHVFAQKRHEIRAGMARLAELLDDYCAKRYGAKSLEAPTGGGVIIATHADVVSALRPLLDSCSKCGGHATLGDDPVTDPCPGCGPIRALVGGAE